MKKKFVKNKGIVFWITGLSGSGKTRLGQKLKKNIIKKFGPTIIFSGDDIRTIFLLKKYSSKDRLKTVKMYCNLCKKISDQNINVIFCVVGLMHEIQNWNRKNIKNYLEICIKSPIDKIIKFSNKKIYKQKNVKNIVGIDIKAEFPKKPEIIINNDFSKSINYLSNQVFKKINKIC